MGRGRAFIMGSAPSVIHGLVSNATEEPPEHIRELVESIRVSRGAGDATAH